MHYAKGKTIMKQAVQGKFGGKKKTTVGPWLMTALSSS